MTDKPPLSEVVPVLVAALVCDVAVADPTTGKKSLIGIFGRVFVEKFPAKRPMTLYIKLTDAEGYYEFDARYVQSDSGNMLAGAKGKMQASDRLASTDLYIPFPPLPIPSEGRYEFQIWANGKFLGSASIDARPRPHAQGPRQTI